MMSKILLITPPFVQPNCPYPATAYLKGYLNRRGIEAEQIDLSIELLNVVFSRDFLNEVFDQFSDDMEDDNLERIFMLRERYLTTIDSVMAFLRGDDPTLASLICMPDFLPQASRFEQTVDLEYAFGAIGTQECAKYLATLYLQDISDFIRATITEHFEIIKYGESLSIVVPQFSILEDFLDQPLNIIEREMLRLLDRAIEKENPSHIGFTIPFPGNLPATLRCAQHIKKRNTGIVTIAGGGYPTTELRSMSDKGIFKYMDYVLLDDGEKALEAIMSGAQPTNAYTIDGFVEPANGQKDMISHIERGCPDFSGLSFRQYFSLCEVINPMHKLWSDGRWNKMTIAHGCYWAKCAFCDTSLDYIRCYDGVSASVFVDWMEQVAAQTGSRGFHFTDEAAPPKLLKEISLEIIQRRLNFAWWTNIRFEAAFTGDLCHLMAAAGCIAVSGGLEVGNERILEMINKGVTIETATLAMRNFLYNGIMVHSYLMYGLPTQTLQECVDSLEVVRQMFRAELIDSAFWHRYAMTVHSPSGQDSAIFGVKRKDTAPNSFANNQVYFVEDRGYNISLVGDALRESLANYMLGAGINKAAHSWFKGKIPHTTIENSLITDHLIKPDASRIFKESARLIWIGASIPTLTDDGVWFDTASQSREIGFPDEDAAFLSALIEDCSDLSKIVTLADAQEKYGEHGDKLFLNFYHSKKWDKIREFGLLQI